MRLPYIYLGREGTFIMVTNRHFGLMLGFEFLAFLMTLSQF